MPIRSSVRRQSGWRPFVEEWPSVWGALSESLSMLSMKPAKGLIPWGPSDPNDVAGTRTTRTMCRTVSAERQVGVPFGIVRRTT